ncbi:MAG: L-threonylcarbamoyladenylate synthase [Actinomycetes bacterium]
MSSVISSHNPDAVSRAVGVLNAGGLVGLPTETVYGLAARADIDDAVTRIFHAKGRPMGHPLILHISEISELDRYAIEVPLPALTLAQQCWPGPLTLLLHKTEAVSSLVTGGRETVAIRIPANECARQIIKQCGNAVSAPSANIFGHVSPTSAQHVVSDLGDKVDLIIDDGNCSIGVESTIVDFTTDQPQLLRPGGFPVEDLESIIGQQILMPTGESRASGMLASHYAPRCRVVVAESIDIAKRALSDYGNARILDHWDNSPLYAASLYTQMRQADEDGMEAVIAVFPPKSGLGMAIRDRLIKASFL